VSKEVKYDGMLLAESVDEISSKSVVASTRNKAFSLMLLLCLLST